MQHPPVAGDEARVRAAKALTEGRRFEKSRRREAITRLQEALAAWKEAGDGRGEVETLGDLALLKSHQGDPQAARDWQKKAVARAHEIGFTGGEARALSNLGDYTLPSGQYDQAIDLYRRSLSLWRQAGGAYEQASTLESLGTAYLYQGKPDAALEAFQEALPLAVEAGDVVRQARVLIGIGSSRYNEGQLGEARQAFEKALELSRSVGGDARSEVSAEHNLGAIYQTKGQLQKAVEMYTRLVRSGGQPEDVGVHFLNLGAIFLELGEPEKALKNYTLSREAYHQAGRPDLEVGALVGIGSAYQRMGEKAKALGVLEEARRVAPQESWTVLHYLGVAQYVAGRPQEALPTLERALAKAQASHTPSSEAPTLLALGSVYRDLGKLDLAADRFGQAIAVGSSIELQRVVAPALLRRAGLWSDRGRLAAARSDVESALKIVESTRDNIAGSQLRTSFLANRRNFYELYIGLLLRLARSHPGKHYEDLALAASEQARARGMLDLLAEGRIDVSQGLDPDLRQRENQLSDELAQAQIHLRDPGTTPDQARDLRAALDRLDERWQALDLEIHARNPRYAQVRYPKPLTSSEIQRRVLDDRTALLEFFLGEESSVLFVVTRSQIHSFPLPPEGVIAEQVQRLREALEKESNLTRKDYFDLAYRLYQTLLAPASRSFVGKSYLLVAPDGPLYYIPFETLLTAPVTEDRDYGSLPYLLRQVPIAYVPSASVLAGLRDPRPEPLAAERTQVAAFAPFASSAQSGFQRLPASQQEVAGIAGLYPGEAVSFLDDAATEDVVRSPRVASARRLHLATHAKTDERYPENSYLALRARGGSGGLLQVREIFNLKLSAELAVLSACQTGLGKEVTGEGLVGLTRAFFYAGVPSLVVSLWNVTDGPTPDLMLDFYKDLDQLHDKSKALQRAKLKMIADGRYPHPSYWAPFILIGEPR